MIMITRNAISGKPRSRIAVDHVIQCLIMPMSETSVLATVMHSVKFGQVARVYGKSTIAVPGLCIGRSEMGNLLLFTAQMGIADQKKVELFRPISACLISFTRIIFMVSGNIPATVVSQAIPFSVSACLLDNSNFAK